GGSPAAGSNPQSASGAIAGGWSAALPGWSTFVTCRSAMAAAPTTSKPSCIWPARSSAPASSNPYETALLGGLVVVGGHGEGVGDDEDAGTPGQGDPDVGADGLLCVQVADRVDDGCHRRVLGEGAHRSGHGCGGDECRADERQDDQRVGERARAVHGRR